VHQQVFAGLGCLSNAVAAVVIQGLTIVLAFSPATLRDSSHLWLSAAATGLLQHVRPAQVAQAVRMMRAIDDAGDPVSAISAVLQVGGWVWGGAVTYWRPTCWAEHLPKSRSCRRGCEPVIELCSNPHAAHFTHM
jgi:hypothetical protein